MAQDHPLGSSVFHEIFNASPTPLFVVDDDVAVQLYNKAAGLILDAEDDQFLRKRSGEALHCLHASETPEGCGHAPACRDCVVRGAVGQAFQGNQVFRQTAVMDLVIQGTVEHKTFLVTATPFQHSGQALALLALEDVSELMSLRRLVPICANCKQVRNDQNYWEAVETYLQRHLDINFTHGICPDCAKKLYPNYDLKGEGKD